MNSIILWRTWTAGTWLALAASIWSALGTSSCNACRDASGLFHGHRLGWFGVAGYSALAAWMFFRPGRNRVTTWLTFAAAGAHVVLIVLLGEARVVCRP